MSQLERLPYMFYSRVASRGDYPPQRLNQVGSMEYFLLPLHHAGEENTTAALCISLRDLTSALDRLGYKVAKKTVGVEHPTACPTCRSVDPRVRLTVDGAWTSSGVQCRDSWHND